MTHSVASTDAASTIIRDRMVFGGQPVTIETYLRPGKDGEATPTILLLHDANGPGTGDRAEASLLAEAGFRVVLPHYLEHTGHARAGFSEIARHVEAWREAVVAVRAHVGAVGICGRSLGGALALMAALDVEGIAAVVVRSAFLPPALMDRPLALPPVLALHGARDAIVQPSHAAAIEAGIARAGGHCEVVLYPGQAHAFDPVAQADAGRRTREFLRRHIP